MHNSYTLLKEVRDSLARIEEELKKQTALLKQLVKV